MHCYCTFLQHEFMHVVFSNINCRDNIQQITIILDEFLYSENPLIIFFFVKQNPLIINTIKSSL
jgi:hypothetical protein